MSKQPTIPTVQPNNLMKDSINARLDIQRAKDKEIVRGKFVNHETPGGNVGFNFKKYKGDPIETYNLKDGEIYSIPLAVARHLNTNCSYPTYNYKNDQHGRPELTISEKVRRFSFQSLEFFEDVKTDLNAVEHSALPRA